MREKYAMGTWCGRIFLLLALFATSFFLTSSPSPVATAGEDAGSGPKIIVLNYHKIEDVDNYLSMPPQDFERQMQFLVRHNYHTITVQEMHEALTQGKELPENPVLITFDDGYLDNYTNAYPILKKYGLKATIFVVTDYMDRGDAWSWYFTWGQAAEMEASGVIDIQSHTVSHGSLTEMNDAERREELAKSKHEIETRLGKKVTMIAYPTGAYNLHIASLVKEAGYLGAFTIKYGIVDRASNLYALERVPIFHTEDPYMHFLERIQYVPIFERLGWSKS